MKKTIAVMAALGALAACGPDLSDTRTQALLAMPSPQHYAERRVARELAARCNRYSYDENLSEALTEARVKAGQPTSIQVRGALELEADIKRRSLGARYGGDWNSMDACAAIVGETNLGAPMSVLLRG